MYQVSVIGCGSMGSALARALLSQGIEVAVWNRDLEKAKLLQAYGARVVDDFQQAIETSPVIVICLNNYSSSIKLFEPLSATPILSDKALIQFTTGTPQDAIDAEDWFVHRNSRYLDAVILANPLEIIDRQGQILIAGNRDTWKKYQSIMDSLSNQYHYTGSNIGSAAILDFAWLSQRLSLFMGAFQGMLLCEAEGISLDIFASTVALDNRIRLLANTIQCQSYDEPINTVDVWEQALVQICYQARKSHINTEVLDFIADKFSRASEANYTNQDLSAIFKLFSR